MIAAAPVERMDVLQGTHNRWGRLAQLTLAVGCACSGKAPSTAAGRETISQGS